MHVYQWLLLILGWHAGLGGGDDEDFEETEQYVIPDAEDESGSEGDDGEEAAAEKPLKQKAKKHPKVG